MPLLSSISQALGLVPNGKRNVTPVPPALLSLVPKPQGNNEVIKSTGADPEKDTVPLIKKLAKRQMWQGKKLADALKGKTLAETVRNNWDFIFNHIQYKLDPDNSETVRSLRRLVHDGEGDCDCFSNALANLLLNQKINFAFRIAEYKNAGQWSHIYIVVPKDGKNISRGYYTIDPVVHQFNYEVPFTNKKDFSMNLVSLDGLASRGSLGACPVRETNSSPATSFVVPTAELKAKGFMSTEKVLTDAKIPFTTSFVNGKPQHLVGNITIPALVKVEDQNALIQKLQAAQPTTVADAVATSEDQNIAIDGKKKLGIAALVLLAVAAVAQGFKSNSGANGLGASLPIRKKLAYVKF